MSWDVPPLFCPGFSPVNGKRHKTSSPVSVYLHTVPLAVESLHGRPVMLRNTAEKSRREIHEQPASSVPDTAPLLPTLLPSFPLLFSWHCPPSQVQPGHLFRKHSSSHCADDLVGRLVSLSPFIRMFCCTQLEGLTRSKKKIGRINAIH